MHPAYCTLAETTELSCNYTKITTCEIFIVLKVPDGHGGWAHADNILKVIPASHYHPAFRNFQYLLYIL